MSNDALRGEVYPLVEELKASIIQSLGHNLVGLYLYGSLVVGDFDERLSDIDLLAIVSTALTDQDLDHLRVMHEGFVDAHPAWDNRVEVAYMSEDVLRKFKTEMNEIARISPGEPLHLTQTSPHWLTDLYSVQGQGVVLQGPPIETLMPHITAEEFTQSVRDALLQWREWVDESKTESFQAYVILAICRSIYACSQGEQISKLGATRWVADKYPDWAPLVQRAESWRSEQSSIENDEAYAETTSFLAFAIKVTDADN